MDIKRNPFILYRGTAVVKWDESKFNHKAKVSILHDFNLLDTIALSNWVEFFDK